MPSTEDRLQLRKRFFPILLLMQEGKCTTFKSEVVFILLLLIRVYFIGSFGHFWNPFWHFSKAYKMQSIG